MKFGILAASALVLCSQTASAQAIIVQTGPSYSPGFTLGGSMYGRGASPGGIYLTGPTILVAPRIYAGPVIVPIVPVVPYVPYGYSYSRPYYSSPYGYSHHHHHHR